MIRLSLLTIALLSSMSANAAYQIRMPLENKLGGPLADNSLSWVGGTDDGAVGGGNGSGNGNGDNGGNGSDNEETKPDQEKTPVELCDEKATKAKQFLSSNYVDASYNSHEYGDYRKGWPEVIVKGCKITINVPKSKNSSCGGNNDYAFKVWEDLRVFGFDVKIMNYVGECQ